jgi:hypothetical protein
VRPIAAFCLLLLCALFVPFMAAQSTNGTISGIVVDPSGGAIIGADILVVNDLTGVRYSGKTNNEGIYVMLNLPPGVYRLQVSKVGFQTLVKPDIVLYTQAALDINFTLPVGAALETVTVQGGASTLHTESGSVSTIIDRKFVENLPLNGRSFNTLLQLTPGVVIAPAASNNQGQFSIEGQRTSSNSFLIDGVSANFGVAPAALAGTSGSGNAQAFSALGGTSSLVSVEALEEFRVETSSFAPEFGRSSGGQVLLTTRSGTNDWHGGVYEYFRNDVLDANDWFANHAGQPRAPERHNDFGGFFGGPFRKNKTFFFASYEGVRLRQPNTTVVEVPSAYARSIAPAAIAPFLAAYPQPSDQTVTPGVFAAPFTGSYSNPSTLNAGSLRVDQTFGNKISAFLRYNKAPSESASRNNSLSEIDTVTVNTQTVTLGVTVTPNSRISNSFRANDSRQQASYVLSLDGFGGAVPPSPAVLAPGLNGAGQTSLLEFITNDTSFYATGPSSRNRVHQLNFADDLTVLSGPHQIKAGVDYRRIYLGARPFAWSLEYIATSVESLLSSQQAEFYSSATNPTNFLLPAMSLFAQDTWKATPRLTLTYGLRWEINPAPESADGTHLAAWTSPKDLTNFRLAPAGTPLWQTTYGNVAPRIGFAYSPTKAGDLVFRGGLGIFYDLASDTVGNLGTSFPNDSFYCCTTISLPVSNITPYLATLSTEPPYPNGTKGYAPDLELPRSLQWNVAVEKSFPDAQSVSVTYVGQAGRRLLKQVGIPRPNANFAGAMLLTENASRSNYDAVQLQYRKAMKERVQAILNYTWSHSLDDASSDTLAAVSNTLISTAHDYSSSSFDVTHSFSAAVVYAVPNWSQGKVLAALTHGWQLDAVAVARSGFPFNATVLSTTLAGAYPRPNRVFAQSVWIGDTSAGGGKRLNPAAFALPATGQQGTEPRNDIRGFGLTQLDTSIARKFTLGAERALQLRADAFNILNHPNFTNPYAYVGLGAAYLESPAMANHGLGGLNPLFQEGGPRSLQISLRLTF